MSAKVLKTCRALGITFGNALPVLSQIAHARLLHRLHHQGKIAAEEWAYRRTQPMHFTGPINIRPYLDREWYQSGGAHEVVLAIGFWNTILPLMPVSSVVEEDGTPPFTSLLSNEQFIHRARLAKEQQTQTLKHPLLHELHELRMPNRVRSTRGLTEMWQAQVDGREYAGNEAHFGGSFRTMGACVFSNGGSSLGNVSCTVFRSYSCIVISLLRRETKSCPWNTPSQMHPLVFASSTIDRRCAAVRQNCT